jgi:cbb3-type cytochrome oxidase subunit 3
MTINLIRALVTVSLFGLFVLLCLSVWSKGRRAEFDSAARLPFETGDEAGSPGRQERR